MKILSWLLMTVLFLNSVPPILAQEFTAAQRAAINGGILPNSSFENGKVGWSNNGVGTFTVSTTPADQAIDGGKGAAKIVLSAQTLNFTSNVFTLPAGATSGMQAAIGVWYKFPSAITTGTICSVVDTAEQTCLPAGRLINNGVYNFIEIPVTLGTTSVQIKAKTTSASTGTVLIDDAYIKIGKVTVDFSPYSEWKSYTPTLSGITALNATSAIQPNGVWRQVGDSIQLQANFRNGSGGAPSGLSSDYVSICIPSGLTPDLTKLPNDAGGYRLDGYGSFNSVISKAFITGNCVVVWKEGVDWYKVSDFSASSIFAINVTVPILQFAGKSSSAYVSSLTNIDPAIYTGTPTGTVNTGQNKATWTTKESDNGNLYSGGDYTVPETGFYDIDAQAVVVGSMTAGTSFFQLQALVASSTKLGTLNYATLTSASSEIQTRVTGTVYATKGQIITFNTVASATFTYGTTFRNYMKISKSRTNGLLAGSFEKVRDLSTVLKTSAYTAALTDDLILVDTTSGAFTLSLPTAVGNTGKKFTIKKTDAGTNLVTIDPAGSETIDANTTIPMGGRDSTLEIVSNGTNWVMIEAPPVSLKYENTAGTTITGSYANVPFATVRYNTHIAYYNGSTGTFTAPYSGKYQVNAKIYISGITLGTGQSITIGAAQGGSFKDVQVVAGTGGTLRVYTATIGSVMNLTAGETVNIQANSDVSGVLTTSSAFNVLTVDRIGNYQ